MVSIHVGTAAEQIAEGDARMQKFLELSAELIEKQGLDLAVEEVQFLIDHPAPGKKELQDFIEQRKKARADDKERGDQF